MISIWEDGSIFCVENGVDRAGVDAGRPGEGRTRGVLPMRSICMTSAPKLP